MRRIIVMAVVALMSAMSILAQKITIVDDEGNAIPLVSVLSEDGTIIGTTDINGVLADVKGAKKVSVTHVAYKPKLVTISELQDGRILMEDVDYKLSEIVVKPKPYVYMEFYFRGFSYIDDSLRVYTAGIVPVAYEIQNKYKAKVRNVWSFGGAANKALTWNTQDLELKAEEGVKGAARSIESLVRESEKFKDYYKTSLEQDGENRWLVKNPEGVVGHILYDDGLYRATLDAAKMQIYANKVNGEEKLQKMRESRNYDFQYSEVYALDDEGKVQPFNKIMELNHWEYNSSKGRKITFLYLYAADHSYMDEDEFKARSKELNKGRTGDMSLEELQEYEQSHNIPALAPTQMEAINQLSKKTGKKK